MTSCRHTFQLVQEVLKVFKDLGLLVVLVAAPFAHLRRQMGSDVMRVHLRSKHNETHYILLKVPEEAAEGRKDIPWYNKEMVQGSSSRKCITL